MIEWLKTWAEGIIIAVIIGTIIEMIVPDGNNKKYIKTVIGVYIMFSIISPVITKFTSQQVSFSIDDYDIYYKQTNTYDDLSKEFEKSNEVKLEELYIEKLKDDINQKMNNKGYKVNDIIVEIKTENEEDYGMITKLEMDLEVLEKTQESVLENKVEKVSIDRVDIEENTNKELIEENNNNIPESDELKQFLSSEYGVDIDYISIK